jgi:hypothetical protein
MLVAILARREPKVPLKLIATGLLGLLLTSGCAGGGQIYEERITERNGIEYACGEGPGLEPCRDANGETYEQELNQDGYIGLEGTDQLEADAQRIRNESPEEAEQTTEQLEQEQWSN